MNVIKFLYYYGCQYLNFFCTAVPFFFVFPYTFFDNIQPFLPFCSQASNVAPAMPNPRMPLSLSSI